MGKQKYTIEYMREVALGCNFKLLNEFYKTCEDICELKCLDCGEVKRVKFNALLRGTKCDKCVPSVRRFTYKQIKNYVEVESGSNCKFLETEGSYYYKCKEQPKMALCKLEFECACGNKFINSFNAFKSGGKQMCNECSFKIRGRSIRYTYSEIKYYIEIESGSGCKLLSTEYNGNHKPLHLECSCGNEFYRALAEFKGRELFKCPNCTGAAITPSFDDVKNDLEEHNIELFETEYINQNTKMRIKYICGFETERDYLNIRKSNYQCPHCSRNGYKRDTYQLKNEIREATDGAYELLSEYKTMNDKVLVKHIQCGNEYEVTPHNFLDAGNRCAKCGSSKGETRIEEYLVDNKISYISQYSFEDLVSDKGVLLRFDFAIFDENEKIKLLIEYDGEFHYSKIFEGHDFEGQVKRDGQKNEYCDRNNYELLRIPYWQFDALETILNQKLK